MLSCALCLDSEGFNQFSSFFVTCALAIVTKSMTVSFCSQFYLSFMSFWSILPLFYVPWQPRCLGFSAIFSTLSWFAFNIVILLYLLYCKLIVFFVTSCFLGLVSLGFHVPIGLFYYSCLVFPIKIECPSFVFWVGSFP